MVARVVLMVLMVAVLEAARLVDDRALQVELLEVAALDLCDVQRDIVVRVVQRRRVLRSALDQDLPLVYLLVLLLLLLTGCFFHGVQCDSSQSALLVPMHFEVGRLAINAPPLQTSIAVLLLAVNSFAAGDSSEVRVSQAAGARRAFVRVPGDHLVDQVKGQLTGGGYRVLQLLEGHLAVWF